MADSQGLVSAELNIVNIDDLDNDDDEHMTAAEVFFSLSINHSF